MKAWNIAHRGGAGLRPENTLAAFSDAVARGCDGAELDVQLSADGVVVVHHDFRLNPQLTCKNGVWLDGSGPRIKDLTLADLRTFDVGRPRPGGEYALAHPDLVAADGLAIPTLAEVLALARKAPRPFHLLVELKCKNDPDSADPNALAEATVKVLENDLDRIVFVGFHWGALLRVRARAPEAKLWFTTDEMEGDLKPIVAGIAAAKADGWFPHHANATAENVAVARALSLKVGAWTVNDPAEMRRLSDLDAICTDRPDVLASISSSHHGRT